MHCGPPNHGPRGSRCSAAMGIGQTKITAIASVSCQQLTYKLTT